MAKKALCSIPDCGKPQSAAGLCKTHYERRRLGVANWDGPIAEPRGALAFFIKSIEIDTDQCILWPFGVRCKASGYGTLNYEGKIWRVTRLVCVLKHGHPPTPQHQAAHGCGVPACFNPRHLRWATPTENSADKKIHGTSKEGEKAPGAVLTDALVLDLRKRFASGERLNALAAELGVGHECLRAACRGISWTHLPMPETRPIRRSSLTNDDVYAIRADARGQTEIAKHYGTSQATVWRIKTRQAWSHLPERDPVKPAPAPVGAEPA